MEERALKIID